MQAFEKEAFAIAVALAIEGRPVIRATQQGGARRSDLA